MKTIGLIDYYISEWHSNHLKEWLEEAQKTTGTDYVVSKIWAEIDKSPATGETTAEWCEKYGATACKTIEEVCESCDVLYILAPDDPDKHLDYVKKVFPYGKPTYMDKTVAPNKAICKEILDLAKKYNTPFFTTSSLRFADELRDYPKCTQAMILGGGSRYAIEIIHPIEMLVSKMGVGAAAVTLHQMQGNHYYMVEYADGRCATLVYGLLGRMPYGAYMYESPDLKAKFVTVTSPFFVRLIEEVVKFFDTKVLPVQPEETLEVMALRDAFFKCVEHPETRVEVQ